MKSFQCLILLSFLLTDLHESLRPPSVITDSDPELDADVPVDVKSLSTAPLLPSTYARPLQPYPATNPVYEVRFSGALLKPLKPKTTMNDVLKFLGWKYSLNEERRVSLWNKVKILLAPPANKEKVNKVLYNLNGWHTYNGPIPVNSDGSFVGSNFTLPASPTPYERINYKASFTDNGDEYWADGDVQVIPDDPNGWSIVADIDDTIRWTGVINYLTMFKTSFLQPLRAIDGMVEVFNSLGNVLSTDKSKTVYHYLSGSPVAFLYTNQEFLSDFKFPPGVLHFQEFAVSKIQAIIKLTDFGGFKLRVLKRLYADFPHRNFIFMGDSGQSDPQVYGDMFRFMIQSKSSPSLPCIYIRLVTGVDAKKEAKLNTKERFRWDMRDIPADRWMVFTDTAELKGINPNSGSCYPPNKFNTWVEFGEQYFPTRPAKDSRGLDIIWKEKANSAIKRNFHYLRDALKASFVKFIDYDFDDGADDDAGDDDDDEEE